MTQIVFRRNYTVDTISPYVDDTNGDGMADKSQKLEKNAEVAGNDLNYGGLDDMAGILLQRAFNAATKYFNREMGKDFQPGYYTTLSLLEKNPGLSQKALAQAIRRDASTLVPFLDKMEEKGWVIRKRSKTDRRAHALHITTAGAAAAKLFDKKVKAIESLIEVQMGTKENRQLKELLVKFEAIFMDRQRPTIF